MFRQDIEDYKADLADMKASAELAFLNQNMAGDTIGAYKTLLKMMAFGIIDPNDIRCQSCYTGLGAAIPYGKFRSKDLKKKKTWTLADKQSVYYDCVKFGEWDYTRVGNDRLPLYPYCNLASQKFTCTRLSHVVHYIEYGQDGWAKSVEVSYTFVLSLCAVKNVFGYVKEICDIAKKHKFEIDQNEFTEALKSGAVRAFTISVTDESVPQSLRHIGFVLTKLGADGNMQAIRLIDYQVLLDNWLSIGEFSNTIDEVTRAAIQDENLTVKDVVNPHKYGQKQIDMIKNDSLPNFKEPKTEDNKSK